MSVQEKTLAPAFDRESMEAIAAMADAIPKNPLRSYEGVLEIKHGSACITDGFCLLAYYSKALEDFDHVLDSRLQPKGIKFPEWRILMPASASTKVETMDLEALMRVFKSVPSGKYKVPVYLTLEGERVRLEASPKPDAIAFNPHLVAKLMKALPKGAKLQEAYLSDCKERLVLTFSKGESFPVWKALLCAVRLAS